MPHSLRPITLLINLKKVNWKSINISLQRVYIHTFIDHIRNILPKNAKADVSIFAKTQHGTAPTEIGTIESKNEECGATTTIGASFGDAGVPINFRLWNEPTTNIARMDIAVKLWNFLWADKYNKVEKWKIQLKNNISSNNIFKRLVNDCMNRWLYVRIDYTICISWTPFCIAISHCEWYTEVK